MFFSVNASGMQQQQQRQQHDQQQTQSKKDQKKQRWYSNDDKQIDHQHQQHPQSQEEDDGIADLKSDMAAIAQNIIQNNASVDNFIKAQVSANSAQKKKRMVLCSICGQSTCPFSKEVDE